MRMMRGWSQEMLAERAGLDRSYVGDVERARRNIGLDSLERLADAFGLSVQELLCEPDPQALGAEMLRSVRRRLPPRGM